MGQYNVGALFERIAIDVTGPDKKTKDGNRFILVAMVYFSKWPEAYALLDQEASTVADVLVNQLISRFGIFLELHSDQEQNFESTIFQNVCDLLGVHKTRTTPLHLESDGMVEKFNRTLAKHLAIMVNTHQTDWDEHLPLLLMAYRAAEHDTTGQPPASILFCRNLRLPCDIVFGRPPSKSSTTGEYVQDLEKRLINIHRFVRQRIKLNSDRMKTRYDLKANCTGFTEGQNVWLESSTEERQITKIEILLGRIVCGNNENKRLAVSHTAEHKGGCDGGGGSGGDSVGEPEYAHRHDLRDAIKASGLKLSSVPQIYPHKSYVVVDAHTDLVLGCRGAEPLRWTFHDKINGQHYNTSQKNITYRNNTIELEYKYEIILTIYNVSHVNVGFYYCHGEKPHFDTPRRSNRIYVFVHDYYYLSVITYKMYSVTDYQLFWAIPCRPTSPDINITLKCNDEFSFSVTPNNYSEYQKIEDYKVGFDPYNGFTIRSNPLLIHGLRCNCFFEREDKSFSLGTEITLYDEFFDYLPYIESLDTVNVGDNITLQCSVLRSFYHPYYQDGYQWAAPLSGHYVETNLYSLKLNYHILFINTLTIKNVSIEDKGDYTCGTAIKYVAVHNKQVSPPRIYSPGPGQEEIQVNSGDNITLRCEGSRPVTWSWDENTNEEYILYNIRHFTYLAKNGLYNALLQMTSLHYKNTKFYYCHEKNFTKIHPLRSRNFYIFVKDKHNLYVPQSGWLPGVYSYRNMTVPCRPTSRDINVTLSVIHKIYNSRTWRFEPVPINLTIYAYDPRIGFTVQMPPGRYSFTATCTFITDTVKSTLELQFSSGKKLRLPAFPDLCIEGSHEHFVFVGDTLQLSCTALVLNNIPDDVLRWKIHNNFSLSDITAESIKVTGRKVLISKLFIYNVKNIDEGEYTCYLPYYNATTSRFISVYDSFDVKPYIENLTYHYAYIGQRLVLRCGANVSHNVDFNISWTTPNATEKNMKIIDIEYTLDVRYRKGQISLEIDNVTYKNEGNYLCYVFDLKNKIGNVTKFVQVKRGKAPTMRTTPSDVNNPENVDALIYETAKLTCPASGDPKPTITWLNDSTEVQNLDWRIDLSADNSELTILFVQSFDTGLYTCVARNLYGEVSHVVHLRVKSESFSGGLIAGIICMAIAVIALAVAIAKFEYKKKRRRRALLEDGFNNFKFGEAEQAALSAYDTKWEIPRNKIKLGRNLGSGYFGLVVEATVSNYFYEEPVKTVAVKMLHHNTNNITALHSILSELNILAHLGKHINLINLLGACTENIADRGLLVVIEYCEYGSLRSYLLENRCNFVNLIDPETDLITDVQDAEARAGGSGPVTTLELLRWALQVARGMEFLASRKVVHGDLAARNVLLAENYIVKISDFGLSRNLRSNDYYRKRSQCPLPVMWMALESIRDKTFSTWSDVWSFGVVLWELFSLARTPYGELEPDFRFYRKLESGYRLDQPRYSTREIYQMMCECWCAQPLRRPTFPRLVRTLDDLLQDVHMRCQHYYVHVSDECLTLPSIRDRDDQTGAHDWIALDVPASTETCSNT